MNRANIVSTKRYANLKELLEDTAKICGEQPLFQYKNKKEIISKSYNQFLADTKAFSNVLKSLNLLGKHIAVVGSTSYEWVVSYLGTVNSNSVIVPLDKMLPAEDLAELINRSDASMVLFDKSVDDKAEKFIPLCENVKYFVNMSISEDQDNIASFSRLLEENRGDFDVEIDNDKMCTILFTSGTTGKPKGVMLSHTSLADNATCMDMHLTPNKKMLSVLPIHHAYCFTNDILTCMTHHLTCCFNDSMMRIVKNANLFNPTIMLLVPLIIETLYYQMNSISKANPQVPKPMIAKKIFGSSLETIFSGGAYLNPKLIDAFAEYGISLIQGYGMTEFSPRISANVKGAIKKESVGSLIPGCEAKIVDGEIYVKGKSRMLGYYKDEKSTSEALDGEWLKTGDLGYVDEDGFLFITGRKKNLIILANGENISPEELENKFNGWLVAKELIVHSDNGTIVAEMFPNMDYVEKAGIDDIQKAFDLKVEEINQGQPLYKRITRAVVRDSEFEKTSSGKIKRANFN